jgi:FkbM family methyltransferase
MLASKLSNKITRLLYCLNLKRDIRINIGEINLLVNKLDPGGVSYKSRGIWEDLRNTQNIAKNSENSYDLFLDIGANYGYSSLSHYSTASRAGHYILVEPDARLIKYLLKNIQNNCDSNRFTVVNEVCGDNSSDLVLFSLNPSGSQDNRVNGESNWKKIKINTITIDQILKPYAGKSVFIKIDTQGFEQFVLKGGEHFLSTEKKWTIKLEYAPYWIYQQKSDPVALMEYIQSRFRVYEVPARVPYNYRQDQLNSVYKLELGSRSQIIDYIKYVSSLNRDDRGWLDLMLLPCSS